MKNINLKPSQRIIVLSTQCLVVHKDAQTALSVWQRCRPETANINLQGLNKFYCPPLRLITGNKEIYHFVNDFSRVDQILRHDGKLNYPCLITPKYSQDISRLAWCEVLNLCFLANIYHPDIYDALRNLAPKRMICELMNLSDLNIKEYCKFAGINQSHYEYQQCRTSNEDDLMGLPSSMAWLSEV